MKLTERQQTGVWFLITGIFLLSFWFFSYSIVNWSSDLFVSTIDNTTPLSNDQLFAAGVAAVFAVQLMALTGIPFIITGISQIIIGAQKTKRGKKK